MIAVEGLGPHGCVILRIELHWIVQWMATSFRIPIQAHVVPNSFHVVISISES